MSTNDPRHYDVILAPVITEKATAASEHSKVIFKVALTAPPSARHPRPPRRDPPRLVARRQLPRPQRHRRRRHSHRNPFLSS